MMTSFEQIRKEAKAKGKKRAVVAPVPAAMDFGALSAALAEGLVSPIVIGSSDALSPWVKGLGKKASEIEIIEEPDAARALAIAIGMLKKGEADILMRGALDPNRFLQAVLDKEKGLLKEGRKSRLRLRPARCRPRDHGDGHLHQQLPLDCRKGHHHGKRHPPGPRAGI
jgi:phosphotransacetylase